jgi:trans-aconitate methyltransferase
MPVFGKGRKRRERTEFLETEVYRAPAESKHFSRRLYRAREKWNFEETSYKTIEKKFFRIFEKPSFIETRFAQAKSPVAIVDWGCGNGRAISELAKKFGKKIAAYGFSKDSFKEWRGISNAKLVQATQEDILRYLKDNSVDLLFSNWGLHHFFWERNALLQKEKIRQGAFYVKRLFQKIRPEGIIAFDIPNRIAWQAKNELEKLLRRKAKIIVDKDSAAREGRSILYIVKAA